MPGLRIAPSTGTEPESPQAGAAPVAGTPAPFITPSAGGAPAAGTPAVPVARVIVQGGAAFVDVDGHRGRLVSADVQRLAGLVAARDQQATIAGDLAPAIEAARANEAALLRLPGVVAVRAGYRFVDGWITKTPAVVVAVDRLPADASIPGEVDGVVTDAVVADPLDRLRRAGDEAAVVAGPPLLIDQVQGGDEPLLEAVRPITYEPPAGAALTPVTGAMTVTCHVSPDAGWAVLRPFLAATRRSIVLGMFDFTAPHIARSARGLLRGSDVTWRQTLDLGQSLPASEDSDSNKAEDKPEDWINRGLARAGGDRFETATAKTGAGKTFASAYHIKVAVRDDEAFWLSSGNWQSSNQPAIDFLAPDANLREIKDFNREWHAVVENADLARIYRTYLDGDFETASSGAEAAVLPPVGPDLLVEEEVEEKAAAVTLEAFAPATFTFTAAAPLTVQPILTPDNYADVVLELLRERPHKRLYFQNQSLSPALGATVRYGELIRLLAEYSQADPQELDVRIIFRKIGPMERKLASLQLAGFNMDRVRVQIGCHTKGIVVDGEAVVLGSHNWTNEGVEANRDASLLFRDPGIAGYYENVFLHDWEKLAKPSIKGAPVPVPAGPGNEAAILGAAGGDPRRISWADWLGE